MALKVIPFKHQYAERFRDLNLQWIEKHFVVEPKDSNLLESCEENIIKPGGHIFFAKYDDVIVGCFAFIKLNDKAYELGKMSVDAKYQGLQIGQKLLDFAINFAKNEGWQKLVLYSSTRLNTALHIYRKFGFKEVPMDADSQYKRSDIKMERSLEQI
ncbi:GNAT family N-acetyltransferase [uncultured Kriegella sp.]|uniref:GNAT family N-acetyltransferase n=1 Tax=uncultured Kriegella sp. TaxID=1798910 RepID=UPI0030DA58C7|tara:strand:- start:175161 stop:175631 length:471 start_codon:yes stop_codon:yes gene_type:complete